MSYYPEPDSHIRVVISEILIEVLSDLTNYATKKN